MIQTTIDEETNALSRKEEAENQLYRDWIGQTRPTTI
jgi:hypothetical protein